MKYSMDDELREHLLGEHANREYADHCANPRPSAPEYCNKIPSKLSLNRMNSASGRSWQTFASDVLSEHFSEGSIRGSVFNLCSATLGAGCLSLPYAMTCAGLGIGILMLAVGAAATIFSIHLLVLVRTRTNLNTYESVSRAVFGGAVGNFVESCIILFCFGTAVAYCKTLRDFISPVLNLTSTRITDRQAICAVWLLLLMPLSLIRSVNGLRFSSLFGVLTIIYMVIAVAIHAFDSLTSGKVRPHWTQRELWINYDLSKVLEAVPIIMFAFTCQVNVFGIFDELQRASHARMSKVTFRAMMLCMCIYLVIGLLGSVEFGSRTPGNLLLAYDDDMMRGSGLVAGMYMAMASTLVMAFPLVILPMRSSLHAMVSRCCCCASERSGGWPSETESVAEPSFVAHVFWSVSLSAGALVLSLWVEDVSAVFQVVGGTACALVCFVVPPACALGLPLVAGLPGPDGRAVYYEPLFPLCSVKGLAAVALALAGLVLGGWSSGVCILQMYRHYLS